MPNYSLILDTKFKPFSYQEMLAPVMAATQAHQALEAEYGDLATKASVWERMANEQTDPYAYKMYKTYADDLETQAEQLARSGLSPASRKSMLNMKARYSSEILPIETAYKRREELAAEQRRAIAANPTMLYQRLASQMSLDDFIKNPSLDYGQQYSGALLTQQVSHAAANIAKEARDSEEGRRKLRKILPYQYEMVQQSGFSRDAVMKAILNSPDADKILTGLVDSAIATSGVTNWGDKETIARAYDYARQGLYDAVGQTQYQMITDQFGMQDALNARQHARQGAAQRAAEQRAEQQRLKMYNINPTSLYGTSEVSAKNKRTLDLLTQFRNKGYFNSQGQLTKRGIKALQEVKRKPVMGSKTGAWGWTGDKEFLDFALAHGHSQKGIDAGYGSPTLNKYYQSSMASINRGELVTGTPNIDVYRQSVRDKTTQDYLLNKTIAALAGGKIYQVGDLTHSGQGVTMGKGKGMSAEDFRKLTTDNPILYVINSPTTNNQLIELSNGTKFIMPKGMLDNISQTNLSTANQRIMNAGSLQETAVNLNQANSYLGSLLDYNEGTGIRTSDGTIIF